MNSEATHSDKLSDLFADQLDEKQPWLQEASPEELRRIVVTMHRVHSFMAILTDLDLLLERIGDEGRQVAQAEAASVMLYDEKTEELFFHVVLGDKSSPEVLKKEIRLKMGQGIAGTAAQSRQVIHVPDVSRDSRFYSGADDASQFQTRNLLAVPMMERGRLVGVLELVNKVDGDAFSAMDQHVLEVFSFLAATAVVNARLIETQIKHERLAAIGQAIASLTHHIKNIITGLGSSVELIDLAVKKEDFPLIRRIWPILFRSTERISRFVQDLLLAAKPRKAFLQTCRLHEIVMEVCEDVREECENKGVCLEVKADENVDPVSADPDLLSRCLLNLVVNAMEAVPPEKGCITLTLFKKEDGCRCVRISDNGPGISPQVRPHLFDLFYSDKGSRGTGLGLASSCKIAQEHGGTLEVLDSDQGACFLLTLPQREEEPDTLFGESYDISEATENP
ncbi:MAG: GAF domain-containing protein [Candidatus Hydrogenedens sp.]|nr:GAF domain-containing protein [Candidatus Hydrogenedens sp.]